MKKITLLFFSLLVIKTAYAELFILNNQAYDPVSKQNRKIAIQWATSAKEVEENNKKVREGLKLNPNSLSVLTQSGKINLDIPEKAEYFRVLVWSNGTMTPDFLTNWVDIIPNKIYTLNDDHLVPLALMSGAGC